MILSIAMRLASSTVARTIEESAMPARAGSSAIRGDGASEAPP